MNRGRRHVSITRRSSGLWVPWRLIRGLLAMAALLVALVGVPWGLLQWFEWPITGIPTTEQISDFPVRLVNQDSTLVAILVVALWAAWALFSLCVVLEAIGEIRGSAARRLPAAGPIQQLARALVASVAMTIGSLNSLTAHGAAGPIASVTPATAVLVLPPDAPAGSPPPPDVEPDIAWQTVTVEEGDTAWELAERHYGDGTAWNLLWKDNRHRPQPDGRTWAYESDAIEPGWQLRIRVTETDGATPPTGSRLAARATTTRQSDPEPAPRGPSSPTEIAAEPGDNMWVLAQRHMSAVLGRQATPAEVGSYWLRVLDANQDRFVVPSNPHLIHPGQTFILPAADPPAVEVAPVDDTGATPRQDPPPQPTGPLPPDSTPAPSADDRVLPPDDGRTAPPTTTTPTPAGEDPSQPSTTTTPATDAGSDQVATRDQPSEADEPDTRSPLLVGIGVTSAALAVGVTRAVARRRRRRNFHGPSKAPVVGGHESLHRQLLLDADADLTDALAQALDSLAVEIGKVGHVCRPLIVQHDANHLDVLLDKATLPAVAEWKAHGDGELWRLDPADVAELSLERRITATPLLVTLGEPDDGGQLYLDLEAAQVVTLVGDPTIARNLAVTLVTEVAHSPFTDNAQVTVVGDLGASQLENLDRVTVVDDWASVAESLTAWTEQSRQVMATRGWPNSFVGRSHDPDHDALIPLIVVAAEPPAGPDLLTLVQAGPAAAAVVTVGRTVADTAMVTIDSAMPDTTIIHCEAWELSLPQLGLTCRPQVLSPDQTDAVADVLDRAEDTSGDEREPLVEALDESIATGTPAGADGEPRATEPYSEPTYEILVRFLGQISVEGGKHRLTAKQTALVAFVALHGRVSVDSTAEAIWAVPSAASDRKRLSNLMTKCRSALGPQHLPVVQDDHYAVGPDVATDLDLFERRVKAATTMPPEQAAGTLRDALELVRGPIFFYSSKERESFTWVDLGNWITHWELHITIAACRATDLYLDLGDPRSAVEVSDRMHRIVPTDPSLTEALMRAHAAAGNRHLVKGVYQAHMTALEQLDLDDVAESTLALYEQLRGSW